MVHECLYVWGKVYFPGSKLDKLRLELIKHCHFPMFPD